MSLRHRHDLWLTRPAVSFGGGTTRESGGNRAYKTTGIILTDFFKSNSCFEGIKLFLISHVSAKCPKFEMG